MSDNKQNAAGQNAAEQIFAGFDGSYEALASYALAQIYRRWAAGHEDAPQADSESILRDGREQLASLWLSLREDDTLRVDQIVAEASQNKLDLSAVFSEVLARRGHLVSRAAALSASNRALNTLVAKVVGHVDSVLETSRPDWIHFSADFALVA
ncbi:hypothetical protein FYJ24_11865 [Actinomycetaceae bacterium WB03_NA08]|uniref:Uncharacterized protein n=1 Tax=Scrofimicrobium canadense TaxID=2652290 RepID=A0A6N7W858_9ACTO|nr:hypothetical protein [Scrofimicrobium canadense]MSS85425.1 hypothetical protein [Scrofimicrobium canadense]